MLTDKIDGVPVWLLCLIPVFLIAQSTWLFTHTRRHHRNRWFWGLWGLIQFPLPIIVYGTMYWFLPWRRGRKEQKSK